MPMRRSPSPPTGLASYRAVVQLSPAHRLAWKTYAVARDTSSARAAHSACRMRTAASLVFRYYPGLGYRFQPLLELRGAERDRFPSAALRRATDRGRPARTCRSKRRRSLLEYDFPYQGGPVPWRSGFAQAVAAQGLARAGALLHEPLLGAAAVAAFRGLRRALLMPIAGGLWIREYGFTRPGHSQRAAAIDHLPRVVRDRQPRAPLRAASYGS